MSDINWKDVLRDKSPLFEQYINDRKAKKRLIPSFESIVRAAISECCIIDISTESVQNNILSQRDKLMFVSRLVHFLNGGNLEIWDLHSFLSCREINAFYDYIEKNCDSLELSSQQDLLLYRLNLSVLLTEIDRIRSSRSSLQKSTPDFNNSSLGNSIQFIIQHVDKSIQSNSVPNDTFSCYGAYLLGYYFFFDLSWKKALHYWKFCHPVNSEWSCEDVDLILSNITTFSSELPSPEGVNQIDFSTLPSLPFYQPLIASDHMCLTPQSEVSYDLLIPNIQYHLRSWNRCSSYFMNVDAFRRDKNGYICLMTSLYKADYISEMICLNQYFSFCSYDDVKVMLKTHDFDNACIYFISDIPLLEILIQLYSERRVVNQSARVLFLTH